jgi:hypothetical protein
MYNWYNSDKKSIEIIRKLKQLGIRVSPLRNVNAAVEYRSGLSTKPSCQTEDNSQKYDGHK